jgi:hypothetical protein
MSRKSPEVPGEYDIDYPIGMDTMPAPNFQREHPRIASFAEHHPHITHTTESAIRAEHEAVKTIQKLPRQALVFAREHPVVSSLVAITAAATGAAITTAAIRKFSPQAV